MTERQEATVARRPQDVTEAELEVLRALWDLDAATIRALADRIYPDGGASEYATVQKLLERLEDKGHVRHQLEGRQNVYAATLGRDDLVARRLRDTADTLCGGDARPRRPRRAAPARHGRHALRRFDDAAPHPPRERRPPLERRARRAAPPRRRPLAEEVSEWTPSSVSS
jgi:BlaI family transcriptional regulator, penicillinase repressor